MDRSRLSTKLLQPLAAFAVGLLLGAVALGERLSSSETTVGGTEAEAARAMPLMPPQTDSPPRSMLVTSADGRPITTEPAAVDADERPAPTSLDTTDVNDIQRLQRLEQAFNELRQRILLLEQTLAWQQQQAVPDSADGGTGQEQSEERPADTPRRRQEALVAAGVEPELAVDIVWRQSQRALERLEIQDRARREGWFGSDRYFDAVTEFEADADDLRSEIGDEAYDRYLYDMGRFNRVIVDSVIQGSPAEQAGLAEGDVIIRYADERLFGWSELREATSAGARGETVHVQVVRGGDTVDFFVPRGPLGVRLDTATMEPLE